MNGISMNKFLGLIIFYEDCQGMKTNIIFLFTPFSHYEEYFKNFQNCKKFLKGTQEDLDPY